MVVSISANEKRWRAESDAHAIANADAIKGDPARLKAAQGAAKRILKDEQQAAKDAKTRAAGISKLAKGGAAAFAGAGKPKKAAKKK